MKRLVVLLVCTCATLAWAQRLPGNAIPSHYQLSFEPDFAKENFAGNEVIDVRLPAPTKRITLNAYDLTFDEATVTAGGKTLPATVALDREAQTATLELPETLPAGEATIRIRYTGVLNKKLRGFYLSQTEKRKYAATQFESTSARWAFPCFDEPAYKATFDITAIVDAGDTAISNGSIERDTPGPGAKHTLKFTTTPRMSTYLVALAVGDWKCVSGQEDGIPLRVCAVPGKEEQGRFALEATKHILHFYGSYYRIKYPFKKLDELAMPDFGAGAMENTAAIFFREADLLLDEDTAPVDLKSGIASVIAHEMAHQWFGDLVTMQWWDDIWLNEGFATWMAPKPVEAWRPEWGQDLDEIAGANNAKRIDARLSTRPIRQQAATSKEIDALFDGIAYGKTATVLRMIEAYLGPEVFREGVNNYLAAHAYGNSTAEDFWSALAAASGKPVDKVMESFVTQPGVPMVTLETSCAGDSTKVHASQKRFFTDAGEFAKPNDQLWQIPLCMKAAYDKAPSAHGSAPLTQCEVLSQREQTFLLPGCAAWVFPNAGARGYYVYSVPAPLLRSEKAVLALTPQERISLLGDESQLVNAGLQHASDYLELAEALRSDHSRGVVEAVVNVLGIMSDYLVDDGDRAAFEGYVRAYLRPILDEVGMSPQTGEAPDRARLRALAFSALGNIGQDAEVIARARQLTAELLENPDSVESNLAGAVLDVAATHGDEKLYNKFLAQLKTAKSPSAYYAYFWPLSEFRDPALARRTLEWSLGPEVRLQDIYIASALLYNTPMQATAWDFIKAHYAQFSDRVGENGTGFLMSAAGAFCDAGLRKDAEAFFAAHPEPGTERILSQARENAGICMAMKQRESTPLRAWLAQHSSAAAAPAQK